MGASTTFKKIREDVAAIIVGISPTINARIKFREIEDTNLLVDIPMDRSQIRRFEVDSGGIEGFQSTMSPDLTRDQQKELIVSIAYPILDNNKEIRDMADSDESVIIRELQLPGNRPYGVLQISLNNTGHTVDDGLRIVQYSFLVHYNHS